MAARSRASATRLILWNPRALKCLTLAEIAELRCHFHVPLFTAFDGALTTTRANVAPAVAYALEKNLTDNFIAETYTWNVLAGLAQSGNAGARALVGSDGTVDVKGGIVSELKWCAEIVGR